MISGKDIKEIRLRFNLSQERFAHLIGCTLGTVNRWENGLYNPSAYLSEKIEKTIQKLNKLDGENGT